MKLASKEQSKMIWDETSQWFMSCPANSIWSDSKGCAKSAVAEYIANFRYNVTIYGFAAEK